LALRQSYIEEEDNPYNKANLNKPKVRVDIDNRGGPVVASVTLKVIKHIGNYFQMIQVLQPIANDVFTGLQQIFEFYMYTIYSFFGIYSAEDNSAPAGVSVELNYKLRPTIIRLLDEFGKPRHLVDKELTDELSKQPQLVYDATRMQCAVELSESTLHALSERIVGAESLIFLTDAFTYLKEKIKTILPKTDSLSVSEFYARTVDMVPELRTYIYKSLALQLINFEPYLQIIANTKWDLKNVVDENNAYIDQMLEEFRKFGKKLKNVDILKTNPELENIVWEHLIFYCMEQVIEGLSRVKKCNSEGRTLMKLDSANLQRGLQELVKIRPIPGSQMVDLFIQAFYYTDEKMFSTFFRDHPEFTLIQVKNLLSVIPFYLNLKKPQKTELLQHLDEIDKGRQKN